MALGSKFSLSIFSGHVPEVTHPKPCPSLQRATGGSLHAESCLGQPGSMSASLPGAPWGSEKQQFINGKHKHNPVLAPC